MGIYGLAWPDQLQPGVPADDRVELRAGHDSRGALLADTPVSRERNMSDEPVATHRVEHGKIFAGRKCWPRAGDRQQQRGHGVKVRAETGRQSLGGGSRDAKTRESARTGTTNDPGNVLLSHSGSLDALSDSGNELLSAPGHGATTIVFQRLLRDNLRLAVQRDTSLVRRAFQRQRESCAHPASRMRHEGSSGT